METPLQDLPINVRSYQSADAPACRKLYVEGLLGGKLADNDTGLDIDDIENAYMRPPGNHFWVAETEPQPDGPMKASARSAACASAATSAAAASARASSKSR